jgi:hypothetical protein
VYGVRSKSHVPRVTIYLQSTHILELGDILEVSLPGMEQESAQAGLTHITSLSPANIPSGGWVNGASSSTLILQNNLQLAAGSLLTIVVDASRSKVSVSSLGIPLGDGGLSTVKLVQAGETVSVAHA